MDPIAVSGLEVEAASEHLRLEAGFVVEGDDVPGKVPPAPRLFNDADFGVADEAGSDKELDDERYCGKQNDDDDSIRLLPKWGIIFSL